MRKNRKSKRGAVLLTVVIAILMAAALAAGLSVISTTSTYNELKVNGLNRAHKLAEGGLRYYDLMKTAQVAGTYNLSDPNEQFNLTITPGTRQPDAPPKCDRLTKDSIASTGIYKPGTSFEARRTIDTNKGGLHEIYRECNDFVKDKFDSLSQWTYNSDKVTNTWSIQSDWGVHSRWATFKNMDSASAYTDSGYSISSCGTGYLTNSIDDNWDKPVEVNAGWAYDTSVYRPGTTESPPRSIKADAITHNQTAQMRYTTTTVAGNVTFYVKVSSEAGYDYFRFYVDGTLKSQASGNVDWTLVTVAVTAGDHRFVWEYKKDGAVSAGSDTAWVDDLIFPQKPATRSYKYEEMRYHGNPCDTSNCDCDTTCYYRYKNWATKWRCNNYKLSYDVQVKIGWGYQLPSGGQGINFRWHPNPTYTSKYQGYGVSYLYHTGLCEFDYIDDGIKPSNSTRRQPLVVLWKQTVDSGGITTRQWLAYHIIPHGAATAYPDGRDFVLGPQWTRDGIIFNDLASLFVRIEEGYDIRGKKTNDIRIFIGDAATMTTPVNRSSYTGNTNPMDGNRKVYPPSYSPSAPSENDGIVKPPTFTSLSLLQPNIWTTDRDYMKLITWNSINTSASGLQLLSDGYTIRDKTYVTPESGTFSTSSSDCDDEIALHVFGNATYNGSGQQKFMSFDDLDISILRDN
ncbi:MAG: hypothetical protein AB1641_15775 [Thermodesulfobacteriota bacterium]